MTTLMTDFDGVLAPIGGRSVATTLVRPGGWLDSAFVLNGLPEVLFALHTSGRFRWQMLSSWGAEVTAYLTPFGVTGIEALVPGAVGGELRNVHGKAAAVEAALAEGEAVVWVDDVDIQSFRDEYPDHHLLLSHPRLLAIETDPAVGMTPADLRAAIAFADRHRV